MKKTEKILFTVAFVIFISSCKQEKVELVYENGNQKISVKIEDGKDYLFYDQPIRTDFVVENIDPISLAVLGPGIRVLGTNNDKTAMRTEINVPSNYLEKDTLTIKVRYGEGYNKGHVFNIPVKKIE